MNWQALPLMIRQGNHEISRATNHQELNKIAVYYFDGQGKAFRPMVAILMAKALNYHMHNENRYVFLMSPQRKTKRATKGNKRRAEYTPESTPIT
uniref:Uncharacterized protein n=1 Tax=Anopheles stephensi TaxID=30069 RepID=A0A182Y7L7_ANOST